MSTDSFVVSPLFFPGGDIGSLAVHGTVNDVAMSGARPLYLSAGFVIEEGFPLADLQRIARSMGEAARAAGVAVITGDTKVVERGKADGLFVNTAGIGIVPPGIEISGDRARPGDAILISGSMGDHGVAIMAHRAGLEFETTIAVGFRGAERHRRRHGGAPCRRSACCAIRPAAALRRRSTRSATNLPWACGSTKTAIPIRPEVLGSLRAARSRSLERRQRGQARRDRAGRRRRCVCSPSFAAMRSAAMPVVIGEVIADPACFVRVATRIGGERIVDWLAGEQLPRIC